MAAALKRAWDDLQGLVSRWEKRLERERLGVIEPGEHRGTKNRPIRFETADHVGHRGDNRSYRRELQIRGSIWDLSATVDQLLAALYRYPFKNRKDRRICELLAERVPWHRIAVRARCSKRRVSAVNRLIQKWKDPESEAGLNG